MPDQIYKTRDSVLTIPYNNTVLPSPLDNQSEKIRPEKVLDAVIESIDQLGNVKI